jgi:hypothetical protein
MTPNTKTIVADIAERIAQIQAHVDSINGVIHFLGARNHYQKIDSGELIPKLIEWEIDEWRNLFMFANIVDQKERDRIKAAGYERFLKDGMTVSHFLTGDGSTPSSWLSADEDKFREMCRKAFAPQKESPRE